ncbi:PBSX family phage terminase large subunit [Anaerotignum sp.]|uniref:PBSX family phage terminase large subunit n=1 Tax=Anaerotignum sp. TaxID=2039241 RepID=UPI0028AFEC04|nr:PBSX family phage terminase large subunit [Anaerotignum sp.]
MQLSSKQKEYWNDANCRWNIKSGATRSGKTYLDYYMIPRRIRAVRGKDGLVVILGNTKGTLQRNIIEPLQKIFTPALVSDIRSDNTAMLFGEKCYCLGADKENQVDRIRGASIKYCYGDEVVTWHEGVFHMLKSRLDKPYSCFDGTCNPESPNHWFYHFLQSDADIYLQNYTLDDNPFLSMAFVENLKKEYRGTVLYDRYILGKWALAEGLIYKEFADNPAKFMVDKKDLPKQFDYIGIGHDFGGNKSNHAFVATGISFDNHMYKLRAKSIVATGMGFAALERELIDFVEGIIRDYGYPNGVYCDSAEQTMINSYRQHTPYPIYNSIKRPINDRIRCTLLLMGGQRYHIVGGECDDLVKGLSTAVWDSQVLEDKRLDNGTSDIDILDADEYSFEYNIYRLVGNYDA